MENHFINGLRKIFYRIINYLTDDKLPVDVGDFRLINRKVIDSLSKIDYSQPYLRGVIATIGFKQVSINYDRVERKNCSIKFMFKDFLKLALKGILNHYIVPLRIASTFGLIVSVITIFLIFTFLFGKLFLM